MKSLLHFGSVVLAVSCLYGQPANQASHSLYSSYWSTDDGFESVVKLRNNLANFPLIVTPRCFTAPTVHLLSCLQ